MGKVQNYNVVLIKYIFYETYTYVEGKPDIIENYP